MTPAARRESMGAPATVARRSIGARELRLWSGLGLGLFLVTHFVNLALGLVSVEAMLAAESWLMAPWRSLPGSLVLYGSLGVHFVLALRGLYRRRTLRMSGREAAQLVLGLVVPLLLAGHVVETRIIPALGGAAQNYRDLVHALWVRAPLKGLQQSAALLVVWGHFCLGLWFWLRVKAWFSRGAALLLVGAVLVPVLALLGFAEAGKAVSSLPVPAQTSTPLLGWLPGPAIGPSLQALLIASLALVIAARTLRRWRQRHKAFRVTFPKDRVVTVPAGFSVLEASRVARIPHASACGGRGRCSTCRIRVLDGLAHQPPPTAQESLTLQRFGAERDVRLACQLRPTHDLTVVPIFAPSRKPLDFVRRAGTPHASHERDLAVLFCDLRGFTRRAEQWLPYDTVYILNRYFEVVGSAVEEAGGHLDKFIGDGALALFGLDTTVDVACRQAIDAAAALARSLDRLNHQLREELPEPLRIAMGLHTGPAIVGEMGYGQAIALTAIGDGINVASRLEGAAKDADVQALISVDLARRAGLDIAGFPQERISVRGRVAPVDALLIRNASSLLSSRAGRASAISV